MKRGRKKGISNRYCKIIFCLRCGEQITSFNGYFRRSGKPLNECKQCNADLSLIRKWARLGRPKIEKRIKQIKREMNLLLEALEKTNSPHWSKHTS
jgi:hypothetical protein